MRKRSLRVPAPIGGTGGVSARRRHTGAQQSCVWNEPRPSLLELDVDVVVLVLLDHHANLANTGRHLVLPAQARSAGGAQTLEVVDDADTHAHDDLLFRPHG